MTSLVLDIGSSSVRAILFNGDLQIIPNTIVQLPYTFRSDATVDVQILFQLVCNCIDTILEHPLAKTIQRVGMTTFVGNIVGIGANGEPITPLYTYAHQESSVDSVELMNTYDIMSVHQRTGCRIHTAYLPAQLTWFKRTHPDVANRIARWMDFATYCYTQWFGGDVPCSYSIASWTGLLNREMLSWDSQWLNDLVLDVGQLSPLSDFDDIQQGLQDDYARRWDYLRDAPFYLAVGDGAVANLGTGGVSPDKPVLTIGTTAAIRIIITEPQPVPSELWAYRVDHKRHLIGGATSEGGNIVGWAQDTLKLNSNEWDETLANRPLFAHGLTAMPLFAGERSPGYHANAVGTIHGLTLASSPHDILQALLEGIALRLRLIYDLMGRTGEYILASGGALVRSKALQHIVADILDVPLRVVNIQEATARGLALLISDVELPLIENTVEVLPRQQYSNQVDAIMEQHLQLYQHLIAR